MFSPRKLPKFLMDDFTFGGKVQLQKWFKDDSDGQTHYIEWTDEMLQHLTRW